MFYSRHTQGNTWRGTSILTTRTKYPNNHCFHICRLNGLLFWSWGHACTTHKCCKSLSEGGKVNEVVGQCPLVPHPGADTDYDLHDTWVCEDPGKLIFHDQRPISKPCQHDGLSSKAWIALVIRKDRLPSASRIQMHYNHFHLHKWPHYWPNGCMKTTYDLENAETARTFTLKQTSTSLQIRPQAT